GFCTSRALANGVSCLRQKMSILPEDSVPTISLSALTCAALLSVTVTACPQSQSSQTVSTQASASATHTIQVDANPAHVLNSFVPTKALGAGIDRLPAGAIDKLINPDTVSKVLSAGWQPVTYRQNTELFVEAWHWNPQGTWSDPSGKGYFTASASSTEPIRHSYGYPLPHRGF